MTEQLYKLLTHAYKTTLYYKKIFDEYNVINGNSFIWNNIPLLSKNILHKNKDGFISNAYSDEYYNGNLVKKITSGSTGMMMEIIWSPNDYSLTNRAAWRYRKKWYNLDVYDKYVSFHSTLYSGNRFVDEEIDVLKKSVYISFGKNHINDKIHVYMEEIKRFCPKWMLVQPSVLMIMLSLVNDDELAVLNELEYIELTGEYLQSGTLDFFRKQLPTVKFCNMYGTTETGCIALQCPHGNCHILGNAYVEVKDADGRIHSQDDISANSSVTGNIILTSLKNNAMPLIRYDIGDIGSIKNSVCECGFRGQSIDICAGRKSDMLELPDGKKLPAYTLWYSVEAVNDEYNNPIVQANFLQEDTASLKIRLILKDNYKNWVGSITKSVEEYLRKVTSDSLDYKFIVKYDDKDALTENNKMMFFKNTVAGR